MLKRKITVLCDAAAEGRAMTKLAALVSSHSGNAEEEGKLQGHFSISLTQQSCRKPMEAMQVTSSRCQLSPEAAPGAEN